MLGYVYIRGSSSTEEEIDGIGQKEPVSKVKSMRDDSSGVTTADFCGKWILPLSREKMMKKGLQKQEC